MENDNFLIVSLDVLPEVFKKVVSAKELISSGKAKSTTEAVSAVGISRSAYYKYKDSVFKYSTDFKDDVVTIEATLMDKSGVLSALLFNLHKYGANILTVNQNIPISKTALVTVSFRSSTLTVPLMRLLEDLSATDGILEVRRLFTK